jgi:hypothetical protein
LIHAGAAVIGAIVAGIAGLSGGTVLGGILAPGFA